jgi:hypothetical protein
MSVQVQESLLDVADEPALGVLAGSVRRVPLSRGAWVDLRPGWLAGSGAVFARLTEAVPWRAERRHMYDRVVDVPRLLCFYGEGEALPDPMLAAALRALNAHYGAELGEPFRTAGLCLYRDGRDSVAWHGDTTGRGGAARRCATRSGTGTCWSWAAAVSAPGSTRCRRRPRRSGRGSACSSGRAGFAEPLQPFGR